MGAARSNPFSANFNLKLLSGEMPAVAFEGGVLAEIVPSAEWLAENKPDEAGAWPACPPHRADVRFSLALAAIFPSRFRVPVEWDKGQAPVAELHRMPLVECLRLLQGPHPELAEPIRAVLAQGIADAEENSK